MKTVLVDVMWGFPAGEGPKHMPMTGGLGWREPGYTPSPGLLRLGQQASAQGDEVRLVCATEKEALEQSAALLDRLGDCDRALVHAPAVHQASAQRLVRLLAESGRGPRTVTLVDPWASAPPVAPGPFGYELAVGASAGQAEVDTLPRYCPVHPWVLPTVSSAAEGDWQPRVAEAVRSLKGANEARLYLNDDRVVNDRARLRFLAENISKAIHEQDTLLELHLRAWPTDLLADDKLLDHLTLLQLGSLEVLAGSFHAPSLEKRAGRTGSLELVEKTLTRINECGLSHLAGLSLALALPGESAEEVIDSLNQAINSALKARIRRIRLGLWLGEGVVPTDSASQDQAFMASHPDWHPMAYRAVFDFVALMRNAVPQMTLIGPGLLPQWEPPAMADEPSDSGPEATQGA